MIIELSIPAKRAQELLTQYFSHIPGTTWERAYYSTKFDREKRIMMVRDGTLTRAGIDYVLTGSNGGVNELKVIELNLTRVELHQVLRKHYQGRLERYDDQTREYEIYVETCARWQVAPLI